MPAKSKTSAVQAEWDRLLKELPNTSTNNGVDFDNQTVDSVGAIASQKMSKQQKRDMKRNDATLATYHNMNKMLLLKPLRNSISVYKRDVVYPANFSMSKAIPRFIEVGDKDYEKLMLASYKGFVVQESGAFSENFHENFKESLEKLNEDGVFQYDMTQPAGLGTKLAKTFVTRCLLGDAGITYKYLGIRMFSLPWNDGEIGASPAYVQIGKLSEVLVDKTQILLNDLDRKDVGSCRFNMTLINRCIPDGAKLKEEPLFKKDKSVVSWHADSTLEHFSSIAVYNITQESSNRVDRSANESKSGSSRDSNKLWRIALRVAHDAEGPGASKKKPAADQATAVADKPFAVPPVAIALPSQWSYFLLDDFNHHHQHAVLAGSSDRWSSTHRVCRTDGHTFWSIKARCAAALQGTMTMDPKQLRSEQLALSEVEFEWIRMFYVQGQLHHDLHLWWHEPMLVLLDLWKRLEQRCLIAVQALKDSVVDDIDATGKALAKRKKRADAVSVEVFNAIIDALEERQTRREGWKAREEDAAFKTLPKCCRPIPAPFPTIDNDKSCSSHETWSPTAEDKLKGMLSLVEELKRCQERFSANVTKKDAMLISVPKVALATKSTEKSFHDRKPMTAETNIVAASPKPSGIFSSFFATLRSNNGSIEATGNSAAEDRTTGKAKSSEKRRHIEMVHDKKTHGKKSKRF